MKHIHDFARRYQVRQTKLLFTSGLDLRQMVICPPPGLKGEADLSQHPVGGVAAAKFAVIF